MPLKSTNFTTENIGVFSLGSFGELQHILPATTAP